MPLPPSVPREELHFRRIALRGYARTDGLFDIEAHLVDSKTEEIAIDDGREIPAGQPIHDMWLRLVVDEELMVHAALGQTDASPYGVCPQAAGSLREIEGLRIGAGWARSVRERLAGRKGCTHLMELLTPLATVAFQTLVKVRKNRPAEVDANGRPRKIDSCYAYAADGELVRKRWPIHHEDPV